MRARGFVCVNAHPGGCFRNVEQQVQAVTSHKPAGVKGPRNVLVIGSSTGYGLASRIAAAWGCDAATLGVFFERPPEDGKTATAGYYNSVAFHQLAAKQGLYAGSINGDAFSDDVKRQAATMLRDHMGPLDLVVYSLASPRRVHPRTGVVHSSSLKPVGQPFTGRTVDLNSEKVVDVTIEPATEQEVSDTVAVMGGEDWQFWMDMLHEQKLLASGVRTVAFSYIGPEVTWAIYTNGAIGRAKKHLEETAARLDAQLQSSLGGHAWVSVNKAVVTQASAAIPVVPLYLSLLPRVMKAKGLEEGCIEQMRRLLFSYLVDGKTPVLDEARRIRMDDWEMRQDVQAEVAAVFPAVTSENLQSATDFGGFKRAFRNLFGFEVDGVDYTQPVEIDLKI